MNRAKTIEPFNFPNTLEIRSQFFADFLKRNLSDNNKPRPLSSTHLNVHNEFQLHMNASNLQTDSNARTPHAKKQYTERYSEKINFFDRSDEILFTDANDQSVRNVDFIKFYFSIFSVAQSGRWSCHVVWPIHKIAKQATICSSFMIAKWQSTDELNARGEKNAISVRIHVVEMRSASYSHIREVRTNRGWR